MDEQKRNLCFWQRLDRNTNVLKTGDVEDHIPSFLKKIFAPVLSFYWDVDGASSCFRTRSRPLKCFYMYAKTERKILLMWRSVFILNHTIIGGFPGLKTGSRIEWNRLLSAVDCSHRLINDCLRFFKHFVILIVNKISNC